MTWKIGTKNLTGDELTLAVAIEASVIVVTVFDEENINEVLPLRRTHGEREGSGISGRRWSKFQGTVHAKQCKGCGELLLDGPSLVEYERHIAAHLAESGARSGEAVRYMRKALGLRAVDLAELIDVAPETISRWETGVRSHARSALALLGALVIDAANGRHDTIDRLRALKNPRKLPKVAKLGKELQKLQTSTTKRLHLNRFRRAPTFE